MKRLARGVRVIGAVAAIFAADASAASRIYAEGQVWEYHVRPGDEGSLLKIQRIERDPVLTAHGPIYHISIIGFRLSNPRMVPVLPHAPVSRATLDDSVTRLGDRRAVFPDADAGIAEWKQARGGVYTVDVATIVGLVDAATKDVGRDDRTPPAS